MTGLIQILTWLPLALVVPAVTDLPRPINVKLDTDHLGYILRWDPGPGTPTGTSYSVSIQTERDVSLSPVIDCQHVQEPLTCHLPRAFLNPVEIYIVHVTAQLEAQRSQPAEELFTPSDFLVLPRLTAKPCGRDLCVDLHPPHQHLHEIYDRNHYQFQISSNIDGGTQFFKDLWSLRRLNLTNLSPGKKYCISVRFLDSPSIKQSNFSQPVCVYSPGLFSADPLISAALCMLVVSLLVILALLFGAGFICLKRSPMPSILTSVRPLEEVLVRESPTSLLNVSLVVPPAGQKTGSQSSSEDSDEEDGAETSCRSSSGARYTQRIGTSSSSSSSSKQKPQLRFCSRTPEPEAQILTETQSRTEGDTPSSNSSTRAGTEEEVAGQEVNLFTLTFGSREEEEEDYDASEEFSAPPAAPAPPIRSQSAAVSSWAADGEEPEEDCGYMGRPPADVLLTSCQRRDV